MQNQIRKLGNLTTKRCSLGPSTTYSSSDRELTLLSQIFCSWNHEFALQDGTLPPYQMPVNVGRVEQLNLGFTGAVSLRIVLKPQPLEPVSWVCGNQQGSKVQQFNLRCGQPIGRKLRIYLVDVHGNECHPPAGIESPIVGLRDAQVSGKVDRHDWSVQREGGAWFLPAARLVGPAGSVLHLNIREKYKKYEESALMVVNLAAVRFLPGVRELQA
jgi:hypothetical protein